MDTETTLWAIFAGVMVSIIGTMVSYAFFVAVPEHNRKVALCEQAGGIAVTDDGRYRLCVDANTVIQIDMPEDLENAN
jgi:hypothetical protein